LSRLAGFGTSGYQEGQRIMKIGAFTSISGMFTSPLALVMIACGLGIVFIIGRASWRMKRPHRILRLAQGAMARGKYMRVQSLATSYLLSVQDAEAYLLLGRVALAQEAWEQALALFGEAVKHTPNHPWAWGLLGYAALRAKNYAVALPALQRARAQHPDDLVVLRSLLIIARKLGNTALRLSVRRDLMKLDPRKYSQRVAVQAEEEAF